MRKVITLFLAAAVLFAGAAAPGVLNQPSAPAIESTQNEGELEIKWNQVPGAQYYTVGWINWTEGQPVHASGGDWLSLFHYTTLEGDRLTYLVKRQRPGDVHYAIIRATDVSGPSGRFGGGYSLWSAWSTQPARPLGQPAQGGEVAACTGDDFNRDEWGSYPAVDPNATPRWTKPSDDVSSRDITQDHHVALKDAHISGGCDWSATQKDQFSSDADNLNPTTRSFNSSKADRTPDRLTGIAERIIDMDSEKCDYATQHEEVKDEYGLTMTQAERATVDSWLALCQ